MSEALTPAEEKKLREAELDRRKQLGMSDLSRTQQKRVRREQPRKTRRYFEIK